MKKCPFCAVPIPINRSKAEIGAVPTTMNQKKIKVGTEEIQDDAIKCRHCNEFLTDIPSRPNSPLQNSKVNWTSPGNPLSEKNRCQDMPKTPWYAKTATLVVSFLTVGPFALPLVWFNPAYSRRKKIILTLIVLVLTYALVAVFIHALKTILDFYKQAGIF